MSSVILSIVDSWVRHVSAFRSYAELTKACREDGYIPTISAPKDRDRETIRAKEGLTWQLRSDGFAVFDGRETLEPLAQSA